MNMTNELQIGDFVLYGGEVFTVRQVSDIQGEAKFVCENEHETLFTDSVEPIPLTAEILEKNGFKLISEEDKMYRLNLTEDESVAITADFNSDEPYVHARNNCYHVSPRCFHVHQLQNALRAIGIYVDVVKKI